MGLQTRCGNRDGTGNPDEQADADVDRRRRLNRHVVHQGHRLGSRLRTIRNRRGTRQPDNRQRRQTGETDKHQPAASVSAGQDAHEREQETKSAKRQDEKSSGIRDAGETHVAQAQPGQKRRDGQDYASDKREVVRTMHRR